MTINSNQTNFGVRLRKDLGEELHNFISQRGGTRNALLNHAISQYLESQSKKESPEIA